MLWRFLVLITVVPLIAWGERPNVVVFISDDVSWNDHGCYGNPVVRTPNIDRLAAGGIKFENAFLTASSCSPSRSSIITGRYPHNNGKASELHRPIAWNLPSFPSVLREAGYYTALSGKNHMSWEKAPEGEAAVAAAWDHVGGGKVKGNSGGHGKWVEVLEGRPQGKAFFCWFAANDAHRGWDADRQWDAGKYGPMHRVEDVVVPEFLVDEAGTREDLASYYNEVTRFDFYIGEVVKQLEAEGELENTLIFVLSDNGRPFPRAKTRLHDSGMKTALVAHWPAGIGGKGRSAEGLVSVIDLAPTILRAAGAEVPASVQGVSLMPVLADASAVVRTAAFSEHNWHDYEAHGRSVRSGGFLYVRNARPALAWQGPADSVRSASHRALRVARDGGALSEAQEDVFLAPRPGEELYRVGDDPQQLRNLVGRAEFEGELERLRGLLDRWQAETGDSVPVEVSQDFFDRESGDQLPGKRDEYFRDASGWEKGATGVNAKGPGV